MIVSFHLATTVANMISPLCAPKFRPTLLASTLALPASRDVFPEDRCPVVLGRSGVQVDMFRWGWTDKRTMKSIYFCQARADYGRRCLVPASAIHLAVPCDGDAKVYRITSRKAGPMFMGAVWRPTSPGAPQSIALMLDRACSDMPEGATYQPVLIAPAHAQMFLDHNLRNVQQLQSPKKESFHLEWLGVRDLIANSEPFGAEADPCFAVQSAVTPRILPDPH